MKVAPNRENKVSLIGRSRPNLGLTMFSLVRWRPALNTRVQLVRYIVHDALRPHQPRTQPVASLGINAGQHADVCPNGFLP